MRNGRCPRPRLSGGNHITLRERGQRQERGPHILGGIFEDHIAPRSKRSGAFSLPDAPVPGTAIAARARMRACAHISTNPNSLSNFNILSLSAALERTLLNKQVRVRAKHLTSPVTSVPPLKAARGGVLQHLDSWRTTPSRSRKPQSYSAPQGCTFPWGATSFETQHRMTTPKMKLLQTPSTTDPQ